MALLLCSVVPHNTVASIRLGVLQISDWMNFCSLVYIFDNSTTASISLPLFASPPPKNFPSLSGSNFQAPNPPAYDTHRSYQTVVLLLSAAHAEGQSVQV